MTKRRKPWFATMFPRATAPPAPNATDPDRAEQIVEPSWAIAFEILMQQHERFNHLHIGLVWSGGEHWEMRRCLPARPSCRRGFNSCRKRLPPMLPAPTSGISFPTCPRDHFGYDSRSFRCFCCRALGSKTAATRGLFEWVGSRTNVRRRVPTLRGPADKRPRHGPVRPTR